MRLSKPKHWYTLFAVVCPALVVYVFYLYGNTRQSWGMAMIVVLFCLSFITAGRQQKKWDDENGEEVLRARRISRYATLMDEAMRARYPISQRYAEPWDDGDKFNPTIYAEYVSGQTKFLVRSYTIWGRMTVYELKEQGVEVVPLGTFNADFTN